MYTSYYHCHNHTITQHVQVHTLIDTAGTLCYLIPKYAPPTLYRVHKSTVSQGITPHTKSVQEEYRTAGMHMHTHTHMMHTHNITRTHTPPTTTTTKVTAQLAVSPFHCTSNNLEWSQGAHKLLVYTYMHSFALIQILCPGFMHSLTLIQFFMKNLERGTNVLTLQGTICKLLVKLLRELIGCHGERGSTQDCYIDRWAYEYWPGGATADKRGQQSSRGRECVRVSHFENLQTLLAQHTKTIPSHSPLTISDLTYTYTHTRTHAHIFNLPASQRRLGRASEVQRGQC